jgi:hypothetical protein
MSAFSILQPDSTVTGVIGSKPDDGIQKCEYELKNEKFSKDTKKDFKLQRI